MGWTHRAGTTYLHRFPQLGTVPGLLDKWPSLKLEVDAKEAELGKSIADALRDGDIKLANPQGRGLK